jgi:hypothetical protein
VQALQGNVRTVAESVVLQAERSPKRNMPTLETDGYSVCGRIVRVGQSMLKCLRCSLLQAAGSYGLQQDLRLVRSGSIQARLTVPNISQSVE